MQEHADTACNASLTPGGAGALGRAHDDAYAADDPPLQVDRQRIIQSAAFRRLQHKTQVFVAGRSDHYRTRMAHTLEVADLARTIAAALGLNHELAEIVSLAHDLGHPPFGHAGERALDACLREHGGFEHNAHSLRVVEFLEHPYPAFRGLNLTHIVRECLAKHTTQFDEPGEHPLQDGRPPPVEGQVAALADRLTYGLHDLQDGLFADLIEPAALAELEIWRTCCDAARDQPGAAWFRFLRPTIDRIRQTLIAGVVSETRRRAAEAGLADLGDPACPRVAVVDLPASLDRALREFEAFLVERVYRSQQLVRMDSKATRILTAVFAAYVDEPRLMPKRFYGRVEEQGVQRVAADYLAGMTDRYCQDEHARLFDARMES